MSEDSNEENPDRRDGAPGRRDGDSGGRGNDGGRPRGGSRPTGGGRPVGGGRPTGGRSGQSGEARRPRRDGDAGASGSRPRREGDSSRRFEDRPRRSGDESARPRRDNGSGRDANPRGERRERGRVGRSAPDRRESNRGASDRGDRSDSWGRRDSELSPEELRARSLKRVRERHEDPTIDADVTPDMLPKSAYNQLKTLDKENADLVARHLVMAARLLDENPEAAHQHAISASRRAGRVGMVRETLGITAYNVGDFALALRELKTYQRITGLNDQVALMVDAERGVGRPDKALELGRSVDRSKLDDSVQVNLAIAMSGARLDLDQPELALAELEIPQLQADKAYDYHVALYYAYSEVLSGLGRETDAAKWERRGDLLADAIESRETAGGTDESVGIITEYVDPDETEDDADDAAGDAAGDHAVDA